MPEYEVVYPELTEDDMVFMMKSRPDWIQAETLQVRLNAFDENLHLTVHQVSSGFSPDFVMEEISSTGSRDVPVCLGCLYSGKVASEPDSVVAMTTMSGMMGSLILLSLFFRQFSENKYYKITHFSK